MCFANFCFNSKYCIESVLDIFFICPKVKIGIRKNEKKTKYFIAEKFLFNFIKLTNLNLTNNQLTSIDLSNLSQLGSFVCDQNQISTIDISNNKNLYEIRLRENKLSELNISNQDNLREIWLNNNKITSMKLGKYSNFKKLEITDNNLQSLDISNVTVWFNLSTRGNPNLSCIKANEFHVNNWTTNGLFNVDNFTTLATNCN